MYCGKCGMPLAFGKTECSICGYDETLEEKKKNKSNKGLIIGIIVAVILIPIIILGIIFIIGAFNTSSMISDSKTRSAISEYETAKKMIELKYSQGENILCDDNCNLYFDIQSTDYEIEVDRRGSDYELTLEFEEYYLRRDKLNKKICSERNLVCTDDEIIGVISFTE